jgi:hypothetical protein
MFPINIDNNKKRMIIIVLYYTIAVKIIISIITIVWVVRTYFQECAC